MWLNKPSFPFGYRYILWVIGYDRGCGIGLFPHNEPHLTVYFRTGGGGSRAPSSLGGSGTCGCALAEEAKYLTVFLSLARLVD